MKKKTKILIVLFVIVIICLIAFVFTRPRKTNEPSENIKSHINEFIYNNETGNVEYKPEITIEAYNKIQKGMTEKEVISILGTYDEKSKGDNSYMIAYGKINMSNGYRIQIILDNKSQTVISKSQIGL